MVSIVFILLPDFALIGFGLALRRYFGYSGEFWLHLERLVYYVMFPALLCRSVYLSNVNPMDAVDMIAVGLMFTGVGLLASLGVSRALNLSPLQSSSSLQTGFRFNTYIGIAIVDRLAGSESLAAFAVLIGVMVPIVNAIAVFFLARHRGGSILFEIARNPLIIGTILGFLMKWLGIGLPEFVLHVLTLFASCATVLGLLSVGAGLRLQEFWEYRWIVLAMSAVKMVIVPCVALMACRWFELSLAYQWAAMGLAVLPTASSAYILAVRMGGDGKLVASIITFNVFLGLVLIPMWLSWLPPRVF